MFTIWAIRANINRTSFTLWEMVVLHNGTWEPLHRSNSRPTAISAGKRAFGNKGFQGEIEKV